MDPIIVVILYFLLLSVSYNCDINKNAGKGLKFRPPGIVFSIVWPIIFYLLYLASLEHKEIDNLYYIFIATLFLWPLSYGCGKSSNLAVYSILVPLIILNYIQSEHPSKYLGPVNVWLIFALIMSCFEAQLE